MAYSKMVVFNEKNKICTNSWNFMIILTWIGKKKDLATQCNIETKNTDFTTKNEILILSDNYDVINWCLQQNWSHVTTQFFKQYKTCSRKSATKSLGLQFCNG